METPGYLDKIRASFPSKTEAEVELLCASSRTLQLKTGLSAHDHRRRGMERLFPARVWHDWRDQRVRSVQECIETRTQELAWMGASSSCKTGDLADMMLTLWWTKPEMTTIYIASPYERATEEGVWAETITQFESAKAANPSLPGRHRLSDNSIILFDRNPRSIIKVATVDKIGKLVGKKSRDHSQGMLIIAVDELPGFEESAAQKFLTVTKNLWSVPNVLILTTGNFAWVVDGFGTFCDPDEQDIPGGYDGFDADTHFRWRTKRGGLVLRFDGMQSPNVKAGRDIYPFVTTNAYVTKMAAQPGGLTSPDAMRFVRSAPVTSLNDFTVTNGDRIRAGGCLEAFVWTSDAIVLFVFIDPGFGGDDCVLQKFKMGWMPLKEGGKRQVVALWEEPYVIPIKLGRKDAEGVPIPVDDQIVDGAKEHCRAFGIPESHVGYDGSMRASIVQKFASRWGLRVQAIDSRGSPTDRRCAAGESATWKDRVDRLLSVMWFATASLIDSFQLKNLQASPKGVEQLKARQWMHTGKNKKKVQTKSEYMEQMRKQGKSARSPGEADAIVGGVEMARRLGLSMEGVAVNGGAATLLAEMLRERELKKTRATVPGLREREELPWGRLHAMSHQSFSGQETRHALPAGRLHRR